MTIKNQYRQSYHPQLCWVGDTQKICYSTRDEAEAAAVIAQHDHQLNHPLNVYHCEFGDHWHLSTPK